MVDDVVVSEVDVEVSVEGDGCEGDACGTGEGEETKRGLKGRGLKRSGSGC